MRRSRTPLVDQEHALTRPPCRVVLLTGKGGVGKTSVAAATAVRAAARGARVLVTSTDPAHSLGDALDRPLGDHPVPVDVPGAGRLVAQQLDAQQRLERHWHEIRDYLVALLAGGGLGDVEAEELVLLPGLDELFALVDLVGQVRSGDHDLVVVDCAPTAETLRLLSLPDALGWYVERVLGPGRRLARAVRPLTRARGTVAGVPVPDDEVFGAVGRVSADLTAVAALLRDPARASVRLVANADRLAVAETQRTATTLSLFGYGVDAVVVNRLLPDVVTDPYLARWRRRQADHLATLRGAFAPTPVLTAPLFDDELDGVAGLAELADAVYGDLDETAALAERPPVTVVDDGEDRLLRVALPFVARDQVELARRGADLHVKVAGVRRTIPLPAALRRREVAGARVGDGALVVRFAPPVAVPDGAPAAVPS